MTMKKPEEIFLVIEGFTPANLPMFRLSAYLREFALLLGNEEHVHLRDVKEGSTRLLAFADYPAVPKVRERLNDVVAGTAPKTAMKARKDLDDLLAADNAIGS